MAKQNKEKRNPALWDNIYIRTSTIKQLKMLKIQMEMRTYDDVIKYFIDKK